MKNKYKITLRIAGVIALVAIIGFSFTACGDDDNSGGSSGGGSPFNGTWVNDADATDTITINNPNWTRTKGSDTSGILHYDSSPNPNTPNIRDNSGSNIGEAKIVGDKLHWDIGWAGAVIFSKGTSGGNNGGNNNDKRSTLDGTWSKDGATNYEKFNYIHNPYNPQVYFRIGSAGGGAIQGDLISYDGTTATIQQWDGGEDIVFTAVISGDTLTVSGLDPVDVGWFLGGIIDFNGTYTKGTGSGNNGGNSESVILSLDKIDEKTFTMTVSGATWNPDTYYAYYTLLNGGTYYFDEVRTSATVITYTMNEEYSPFTGTIEFTAASYIQNSGYYTYYLLSGVPSQATITVNPDKSSVTFGNSGGNNGGSYSVGDTGPAGGIIFYVNLDGFTVEGYGNPDDPGYFPAYTAYYLEAAPYDEESYNYIQWGSYRILIDDVTTFTSASDPRAKIIGNGRKNTQIIVNYLANTNETERAAQLCASKSLNGFTDWFLPSLGELNEMCKAKGTSGIPSSGYYWSSLQYDRDYAWYQTFDGAGFQNYIFKNQQSYNVRAVRAF